MKNLISILLFTFLYSCSGDKKENTESSAENSLSMLKLTAEQVKNSNVMLGSIGKMEISTTLRVNGKIDVPPQNMVSVSIPLGGYLKSTKLLPGMKIRKGEIIATIEDQQYVQLQQDYLTTKVELNFTENEYKRQRELNAGNANSAKVLQQSEMDYLKRKVQLKSLEEKLRLINIDTDKLSDNTVSGSINVYAPIDGYVSRINVNIGKYVNPADVVFELVNPNDIHLALTVFEKDIDKLFIGQKLVAFTNNNPDVKHDCEVLLIGQNLSNERSVEVHCHFKDYDHTLIPGMYMNAEIQLQNKNLNVLPEEAVVYFENKNYIFVEKEKNVFVLTEVITGLSGKGMIEIENGEAFKPNTIVVKGAYALLMALKNKQE